MKTIRKRNSDNTFEYLRVKDSLAIEKVKTKEWSYCSKLEWKKSKEDLIKK